jgi:hypothetical protein
MSGMAGDPGGHSVIMMSFSGMAHLTRKGSCRDWFHQFYLFLLVQNEMGSRKYEFSVA